MLKIKKYNCEYFIYNIFYFIILQIIYKNIICKNFAYVGYLYDFNIIRFFVGVFIYLIGTFLFFSKKEYVSSVFFIIMYYLSIVPFIILYQYNFKIQIWMLILQIIILVLIKLSIDILSKNNYMYDEKYFNKKIYLLFINISVIILVCLFMKKGIPKLENLSFEKIHLIRKYSDLNFFLSFITQIYSKIIFPILLVISLNNKNKKTSVFLILLQIYIYSITGFKTYLFLIFVVLSFYLIRKKINNLYILKCLCYILIIVLFIFIITKNIMIIALIFNRVFFLPAYIKYTFFDFFSKNEFLYFSYTSFGKLLNIKQSYPIHIFKYIGKVYFNKETMWTNTGFIADAFSQMGIISTLLISVILIIELYFIDKVTKYNNKMIGSVMFYLFFISLNDGSLISVSFSGGMILAIILFKVFFQNRNK